MSLSKYTHAANVLTELERTFETEKQLQDFRSWLHNMTAPTQTVCSAAAATQKESKEQERPSFKDMQTFIKADPDYMWSSTANGQRIWELITKALSFGKDSETRTLQFARTYLFVRECNDDTYMRHDNNILNRSIFNIDLQWDFCQTYDRGLCGLCQRKRNPYCWSWKFQSNPSSYNISTALHLGSCCHGRLHGAIKLLVATNRSAKQIDDITTQINQLEQVLKNAE
jgi:hypothetical protein